MVRNPSWRCEIHHGRAPPRPARWRPSRGPLTVLRSRPVTCHVSQRISAMGARTGRQQSSGRAVVAAEPEVGLQHCHHPGTHAQPHAPPPSVCRSNFFSRCHGEKDVWMRGAGGGGLKAEGVQDGLEAGGVGTRVASGAGTGVGGVAGRGEMGEPGEPTRGELGYH